MTLRPGRFATCLERSLGLFVVAWIVQLSAYALALAAELATDRASVCASAVAVVALAAFRRPRPSALRALVAFALMAPIALGLATQPDLGAAGVALSSAVGLMVAAVAFAVLELEHETTRHGAALVSLGAYVFALRAVFGGTVDLMPEEAYYWCYSRHPALGYLDHPPLIAWMIAGGTALLGNRELGVRLGSLACGVALTAILFATTRREHGRRAAWVSVGLSATVPYLLTCGMLATPDAPLAVGWAGTLMCVRRAEFDQRPSAWLAAGAFLGLGLLSKYTIGLLALGILGFVLFDARGRAQLRRGWIYAGTLVALLAFTPVILWNAENDWASFTFQSRRAVAATESCGLHELVGGAVLTAGPLLLFAATRKLVGLDPPVDERSRRVRSFVAWTTLAPLAVFATHALGHPVRLHWTGPIWIAWVPSVAGTLTRRASRTGWPGARAWSSSGLVVAVFAGWLFAHLSTAILPLPSRARMRLPMAWSELATTVTTAQRELEREAQCELTLVGMDRNFLASELAFYVDRGERWPNVAARYLFGRSGLMFERWKPASDFTGVDLLLVGHSRDDVDVQRLAESANWVGTPWRSQLTKHGRPVGCVWMRAVQGFRSRAPPPHRL